MTCIAGLVHDGDVWMAGGSASVAGLDIAVMRQPKVFRAEEFLFGFTTSFRMGQLLQHSLQVSKQKGRQSVVRYMQTTFIDAIREQFAEGGFARKKDEVEMGGCFLVGYRGRLFRVASDYQVGEARDGFDAVGCGAPYALGALHATWARPAKTRLLGAMQAAARLSAGVRGPFNVLRLSGRVKAGTSGRR